MTRFGMDLRCAHRVSLIALVLSACWALAGTAIAGEAVADADVATLAHRDQALIDARLQAMPAQRPGVPDLYAIGIAGDGDENVFRNEVAYFETLVDARYGAEGRTITLVNHPASVGKAPRPLATLDNLRHALAGIGRAMDPAQDLLMLFLSSHGDRDHTVVLRMPGQFDAALTPRQLRDALDEAGIRHRLLIISACFSGGFIPALASPDTLVITAARRDRPSFGCGDTASATYFGRAMLIEAMNRDGGLVDAFAYAKRQVARREDAEGYKSSMPQLSIGADIPAALQAWEATLAPSPPVPYPFDP